MKMYQLSNVFSCWQPRFRVGVKIEASASAVLDGYATPADFDADQQLLFRMALAVGSTGLKKCMVNYG